MQGLCEEILYASIVLPRMSLTQAVMLADLTQLPADTRRWHSTSSCMLWT